MVQVRALQAGGRSLISLMRGEPDLTTPAHIVEAAARSLRDERTSNPHNQGEPALREAVAEKLERETGNHYLPDAGGRTARAELSGKGGASRTGDGHPMSYLPTGTVIFLFTDIEGGAATEAPGTHRRWVGGPVPGARLWERLPVSMPPILARHGRPASEK